MERPPVGCSLGAGQLADRSAAWRELLEGWCLRRERLPDSVHLSFRRDPGVLEALTRLTELERECCPWFESVLTERDVLSLDLRASGDGLAVLAQMFGVP